jgi:hypothetical protein
MPLQVFLLAIVAMIGLAALRLARVHAGRTPLPESRDRTIFLVAFLVLPPLLVGALIGSAGGWGPLSGVAWIPLYGVMVAGLAILMMLIAVVAQYLAPIGSRRLLLIALVGSEGDPDALPFDPPVTAKLAEGMALVDRTNAVFPRGLEFPRQVERADFHSAWDALDAATGTLEGTIAADRRLGLGVAQAAAATALDARSRLETLRRIALSRVAELGAA